MFCPSCNTHNRDDARFCKKCGHSFQTKTTEPAEPAEAAEVSQATLSDHPGSQTGNEVQINADVASIADDPSLAPTQILTPEQMTAYHQRRWQREGLESQPSNAAVTSPAERVPGEGAERVASSFAQPGWKEEAAQQSANGEIKVSQPVSSFASVQNDVGPGNSGNRGNTGNSDEVDVSDMPTLMINPEQNEGSAPIPPSPSPLSDEPVPIPPPPPHIAEQTASAADIAEGETTNMQQAGDTGSEENMPETTETAPEQPGEDKAAAGEQPTSANDFAVLAVGTMVNGRYEVTEVVSEDAQDHVYSVIDHQGYQHCWNCGTEQNSKGDEFCNDCGAELLNMLYVMHEFPAGGTHAAEASVLQGDIVNTFVDQGKTYAIEQVHEEQNAFPNGIHLTAASDSDAGDVRRSDPNEDSTLVLQLQRIHESISMPVGVFIVADGMGGHDNGQLASRVAINVIAERMVRELLNAPLASEKSGQQVQPADEETLVALLQGAIEDANAAICQVNQREKTDMGSTITGFMIVGEHAYILNVGDSRTYMVRGGQIYQLTNDHSLVGQLVAGGLIQPDDVYTHPQRNQIFRSLGDKLNVQVDIFKQQLHPGDILLSCCDGLWEMVRNPQIESILNTANGPQAACTQLVETANANGGEDNISVVVVYVS